MTMDIAILLCDKDLPELVEGKPALEYLWSKFFEDTPYTPKFYSVIDQQWPHENQYDCFLITGSRSSVLEEKPWMLKLEDFIRSKQYKKLIGVCFGHQIIAKSLGGKVETGQWHIGVHVINSTNATTEFAFQSPLNVRFNHQDHVFELPKDAIAGYTSAICEYAAYIIKTQILSMQYHPEFTQDYHNLVHSWNKARISQADHVEGSKHLDLPTQHDLIKKQMLHFLSND